MGEGYRTLYFGMLCFPFPCVENGLAKQHCWAVTTCPTHRNCSYHCIQCRIRVRLCWLSFSGPLENDCLGSLLLLIGAAVFGILDNDCTGQSCLTEYLPWESSPCRWYTADPKGHSCPLPEWFNHCAVMHCFAIASCIITTLGVQGLLESGWEPGCQKLNID